VQQLLRDILGVDIALGTLSESEALATAAVDGPVREALQSALAAPVKHADGTTWYRHHAFRSLWVLATRGVTVFTTFESGTKAALSQWLGNNGILISDRGTQLGFWSMRRRQICWAHLLRKFAWYATQDVEAANIGRALLTYARNVPHEWHRVRDGHITPATAARNTAPARDVIEPCWAAGSGCRPLAGSCPLCCHSGPRRGSVRRTSGSFPTTVERTTGCTFSIIVAGRSAPRLITLAR
jgi:transposase